MMNQCYYCEQIFDSKEKLFDHLENHSDVTRNLELQEKKKELKKKLLKIYEEDESHTKKMSKRK